MLSPYRILDLTDDRGHLAGLLLAQLGADVIHVEPQGGHRHRHRGPFVADVETPDSAISHLAQDRGRRSVELGGDLDLDALAAGADVLLECGAIPIDLDALRAAHPGLITVSISAFGQSGPKSGWPATDLTIAAASGTMSLTGDPDRPPVRVTEPQTWNFAAADAACAVATLLFDRGTSGRAQHGDVSAQTSFLSATQFQMMYALREDEAESPTRRPGGVQLGPFTIQFVHPCADGHVTVTFLFGAMIGPYTARLFEWIHEVGMCSDELRDQNWIEYANLVFAGELGMEPLEDGTAAIAAFMATKTKAELLEAALERNLLIAPILTTRDVLSMDHLRERDYWQVMDLPDLPEAQARAGAAAARFCGAFARPEPRTAPMTPAPKLGQHTAEVAAALDRERVPGGAVPTQRPLEGIKVLDFMWAVAGPDATRTLSDLGATVVKVESETRPDVLRGAGPFRAEDGDPEGAFQMHSLNAGKKGLALDMSHPEAKGVIEDLVRWADVVTDSFSAGAMTRWGLGPDHLRAIKPDLIVFQSNLMGDDGPMARYAGFGTMAAAIAGFYPMTGWPDRMPAGPFTAFTDYISPKLSALVLVAALDRRRRTGEGTYIDYSQLEGALHFLGPAFLEDEVNGRIVDRAGNRDRHMAPHGVYPAAGDDAWVAIACETEANWRSLAEMVGRNDLASLPVEERRTRHDELDELIAGWSAPLSPDEAESALIAVGIPAHVVQTGRELVRDPQMLHRNVFVEVPHGSLGHSWAEAQAFLFSDTPIEPTWSAPMYGEHSYEVLCEFLGYDPDRFAELAVADILR